MIEELKDEKREYLRKSERLQKIAFAAIILIFILILCPGLMVFIVPPIILGVLGILIFWLWKIIKIWLINFFKYISENKKKIHDFMKFSVKNNYNLMLSFIICYGVFLIPYSIITGVETDFPTFLFFKWLIFISSGIVFCKIYKTNQKSRLLLVFGLIAIIFNTIKSIGGENIESWLILVAIAIIIYDLSYKALQGTIKYLKD